MRSGLPPALIILVLASAALPRHGASPVRRRLTSAAGDAIVARGGGQGARGGDGESAFGVPTLPSLLLSAVKNSVDRRSVGPLPSGMLTMLLTDIEGSTRLWQDHPKAMEAAVPRHHEIAHRTVERFGGYRPPDQGEGDSIFAVFADPREAVACALAFQRALCSETWPERVDLRVRMALHTGHLDLRDGRNYAGLALNRCARLGATAHGGQTILSESTRAVLGGDLPPGVELRDLGVHRLKDLTLPERVFQVCHPDLSERFPPLRSLEVRPHNLPLQLTRFIGRAQEMIVVRRLLGAARLVTLTGTGGAGKTRLALQVAADVLEEYPDGVWFVELAAVADSPLVPRVVASAIGVREQQGRPIVDTLIDQLSAKQTLVVLDNCEHVVDACARLAGALLSGCARFTVLATSREPLAIPGETLWRVPSLSIPGPVDAREPGALTGFEAVQLFQDRATAANPRFTLTAATAPAVAAICQRLEGIPLAIELAAARLQTLTVEQISERLNDRFRLLTGRSRTGLDRHQTLRATVDWSFALLTEAERVLLRRLSVFAGGFRLDAAEQVCGVGNIQPAEILDLLSLLVTKSLVLLETEVGAGRYRLLETIREYALEKLKDASEEGELRRRHRRWCIDFAEHAEPRLRGPDQHPWLDRLHAELDNFRAAFGWSIAGQEPEGALRLASALLAFWIVRADWSEGREWVDTALGLPGEVDAAIRMKALRAVGELADVLSDYPSATMAYEESLALARRLQDRRGIAAALFGLGHGANRVGNLTAARPLLDESVAILREIGDEPSIARSLGGRAVMEENYAAARALWEQNLAIRRRLGNPEGVGWSLLQVGLAAQGEGDYRGAGAAYEEMLVIGQDLRYKRMVARARTQLADVARLEGRFPDARSLYEQTLPTWREIGHKSGLVDALRGLGDVARLEGDHRRAELLLQESLSVCREIGARLGIAASLQSLAELARTRRDNEGAERLYCEALSLWNEMRHAVGIAGGIRGVAELDAVQGRFGRAARLFAAAEALRQTVGAAVPQCEQDPYQRAFAAAKCGLDADAFEAAWRDGRGLGPRGAVELALQIGPSPAKA